MMQIVLMAAIVFLVLWTAYTFALVLSRWFGL